MCVCVGWGGGCFFPTKFSLDRIRRGGVFLCHFDVNDPYCGAATLSSLRKIRQDDSTSRTVDRQRGYAVPPRRARTYYNNIKYSSRGAYNDVMMINANNIFAMIYLRIIHKPHTWLVRDSIC